MSSAPADAGESLPQSRKGQLSELELLFALVVFVILSFSLFQLKVAHVDQQSGDTAQLMEISENIATRGWAANQILPDVLAYLHNGVPVWQADRFATDPLLPPARYELNHLQFHMYLIMYPIAAFVRFFPAASVLLAIYVLCFTATLLLVYFALRRAAVAPVVAAAFCLLITFHPAWSQGLRGQFYPDRIFIFAGLLFMLLASSAAVRRIPLVAAAILCLSIDERAAITAGLFLLAYSILYWRKPNVDRWFKIGLACALIVYGIIVVKFLLPDNIYDAGFLPSSLTEAIDRFYNPTFRNSALLFLFVNCSLWVLSWFEWRAALIAFMLMIPNLIGTIGGSEKLGWSTHYQDEYLPALIWAAVVGFVRAYQLFRARSPRIAPFAMTAVTAVLVCFLALIDPQTGTFSTANINETFVFWFPREAQAMSGTTSVQIRQWGDELRHSIPEGTVVTTVEAGMPYFYHHRTIRIFPVAVDQADYAVVVRTGAGSDPGYTGVVSFFGPDVMAKANALIFERMKRDHYDFAHPVYSAPNGLTVLRRVH